MLITAGGNVAVTIHTIETVQIGGVRTCEVLIAVTNFELLPTLHIDAVIGADYLRQFTISIDYAHRSFHIER
jgi:hypothetical protein